MQVIAAEELWHFPKSKQYNPGTGEKGLFDEYVNCFLKLKAEASGYPPDVVTNEQRQAFLDEFYRRENIVLDPSNIAHNSGMRALAKLMLNSFWGTCMHFFYPLCTEIWCRFLLYQVYVCVYNFPGKFGERTNMTKTLVTNDSAKYFSMITDPTLDVTQVHFVGEEKVLLHYKMKDELVVPNGKTNVVIAAMTTAHARMVLYDALEKLGADRTCYFDTAKYSEKRNIHPFFTELII